MLVSYQEADLLNERPTFSGEVPRRADNSTFVHKQAKPGEKPEQPACSGSPGSGVPRKGFPGLRGPCFVYCLVRQLTGHLTWFRGVACGGCLYVSSKVGDIC